MMIDADADTDDTDDADDTDDTDDVADDDDYADDADNDRNCTFTRPCIRIIVGRVEQFLDDFPFCLCPGHDMMQIS